jgi:hypothetical protein
MILVCSRQFLSGNRQELRSVLKIQCVDYSPWFHFGVPMHYAVPSLRHYSQSVSTDEPPKGWRVFGQIAFAGAGLTALTTRTRLLHGEVNEVPKRSRRNPPATGCFAFAVEPVAQAFSVCPRHGGNEVSINAWVARLDRLQVLKEHRPFRIS